MMIGQDELMCVIGFVYFGLDSPLFTQLEPCETSWLAAAGNLQYKDNLSVWAVCLWVARSSFHTAGALLPFLALFALLAPLARPISC